MFRSGWDQGDAKPAAGRRLFRRRRNYLRLRDFNRTRPGRRRRNLVLDAVIDIAATRSFRRVCLTALIMLSLIVAQHQREIDARLRAGEYLHLLALGRSIDVPDDLSDFRREEGLSQWQLLHRWDGRIAAASKRFGVRESWIRAVMLQESGGRTMMAEGQKIVSPKGAMGLMQLMPATYAELRKHHRLGEDPFNPDDNIAAGTAYLRLMHDAYGFNGMFAAYNAGPKRLEASRATGAPLPEETQNYVKSITAMLRRPDLVNPAPTAEPERPILVSSLEDVWRNFRSWWEAT